MGSEDRTDDEKSVHQAHLDAFYIGVNKVIVKQCRKFVRITSHTTLDWIQASQLARTNNHPITERTWDDAMTYAT